MLAVTSTGCYSMLIFLISSSDRHPSRFKVPEVDFYQARYSQKGSQPASLFKTPKGYKRVSSIFAAMGMDMPGMGRGPAASQGTKNSLENGGFKMPEELKKFTRP